MEFNPERPQPSTARSAKRRELRGGGGRAPAERRPTCQQAGASPGRRWDDAALGARLPHLRQRCSREAALCDAAARRRGGGPPVPRRGACGCCRFPGGPMPRDGARRRSDSRGGYRGCAGGPRQDGPRARRGSGSRSRGDRRREDGRSGDRRGDRRASDRHGERRGDDRGDSRRGDGRRGEGHGEHAVRGQENPAQAERRRARASRSPERGRRDNDAPARARPASLARSRSRDSSSPRRTPPRRLARVSAFDQTVAEPEELTSLQKLAVLTEENPAVALALPSAGGRLLAGADATSGAGALALAVPVPAAQATAQRQAYPPNPELEAFLVRHPLEAHAATKLRSMPPDQVHMIISMSLQGARDATAVICGRIRNIDKFAGGIHMGARSGAKALQGPFMQPPAGLSGVVTTIVPDDPPPDPAVKDEELDAVVAQITSDASQTTRRAKSSKGEANAYLAKGKASFKTPFASRQVRRAPSPPKKAENAQPEEPSQLRPVLFSPGTAQNEQFGGVRPAPQDGGRETLAPPTLPAEEPAAASPPAPAPEAAAAAAAVGGLTLEGPALIAAKAALATCRMPGGDAPGLSDTAPADPSEDTALRQAYTHGLHEVLAASLAGTQPGALLEALGSATGVGPLQMVAPVAQMVSPQELAERGRVATQAVVLAAAAAAATQAAQVAAELEVLTRAAENTSKEVHEAMRALGVAGAQLAAAAPAAPSAKQAPPPSSKVSSLLLPQIPKLPPMPQFGAPLSGKSAPPGRPPAGEANARLLLEVAPAGLAAPTRAGSSMAEMLIKAAGAARAAPTRAGPSIAEVLEKVQQTMVAGRPPNATAATLGGLPSATIAAGPCGTAGEAARRQYEALVGAGVLLPKPAVATGRKQ
ncbi:unnamed protein product [Prorocentrum cordatum]|uniref:RNA helicase n=1 Tax=Prorocentrum cordatum TaxID=2364126 RepID=A0ABN9Y2E3_9DINO|nr:unnamed protein product [Polarella glacialis]